MNRYCHAAAPHPRLCVCVRARAHACVCVCVCARARARVSLAVLQSDNHFGPEGAGKLAGALEKMTNLQTLSLVTRGEEGGGRVDRVRGKGRRVRRGSELGGLGRGCVKAKRLKEISSVSTESLGRDGCVTRT